MKKYLIFNILIYMIVAASSPVWSQGHAEQDPEQEYEYYIQNQDGEHEQILGGKSEHAAKGLARARERARFMERRPKDTKGGGSVVDKPKK